MAPSILTAVDFAIAQSGKPYRAYGDRFGLDYYDCSGLVIRALDEAGVPLPNDISVEREWGNTVSLYNWARDSGGLVSVDKGVRTRGAIMIKGRWYGNGPLGHTSYSLGGGWEMAAHGRRTGIGQNVMNQGFYQDAFIIPGVTYHLEPPVDPKVVEFLKKVDAWRHDCYAVPLKFGQRGGGVPMLNFLLHQARLMPAPLGTAYGKNTRNGVVHLKRLHPEIPKIPEPGKSFGGPAADALITYV